MHYFTLPVIPAPVKLADYSFQDNKEDVVATQLDSGSPIYRANVQGNSFTVNVTWILEGSSQWDVFFNFFIDTVLLGALPFSVDLITDEYLAKPHKAYFIPNSIKMSQLSLTAAEVTAQLEVEPIILNEQRCISRVVFYNEYGTSWLSLAPITENDLNTLVNMTWPGILAGTT
jgi:hypothetical protein